MKSVEPFLSIINNNELKAQNQETNISYEYSAQWSKTMLLARLKNKGNAVFPTLCRVITRKTMYYKLLTFLVTMRPFFSSR